MYIFVYVYVHLRLCTYSHVGYYAKKCLEGHTSKYSIGHFWVAVL